eukprot:3281732-Prymnesium_polylepis.1
MQERRSSIARGLNRRSHKTPSSCGALRCCWRCCAVLRRHALWCVWHDRQRDDRRERWRGHTLTPGRKRDCLLGLKVWSVDSIVVPYRSTDEDGMYGYGVARAVRYDSGEANGYFMRPEGFARRRTTCCVPS